MEYELKCNFVGYTFNTLISDYIQHIAKEIVKIKFSLPRPELNKEDMFSQSMKIMKLNGKKPGEF